MSLQEIADFIIDNEYQFLNENGLLDRDYIIERFNLNLNQWRELSRLIERTP